jgi:UPF0716 family protein affecting phage T7 exclusion
MLKIIIKTIFITISAVTLIVYMFFNSIIGLLDLAPNINTSKAKSKIVKTKKNLKKGIVKRASGRAVNIFSQAAVPFPLVGAGIAATTVIVITADEYCETQNTLDNIFLILENKEEKDMDISECSKLIVDETVKASKESGNDFKKWTESSFEESSEWLSEKYGETSSWTSKTYNDTSVWAEDNYKESGAWVNKKWRSTFGSDK